MADVAEVNLARLRAVVHSLADGIVISDRDGNLLDWNPAALRMYGFRSVDEVRRHLSTFDRDFELSEVDGKAVPLADWPLSRLLRGETVVGWELQVRRLEVPKGVRIIRFDGQLVSDPAGGADLIVLTLHDVTEMRTAERNAWHAAELLRAVAEGTTDVLFAKDMQGRYVFCNPAAAQYLDHPAVAVLGRTDHDLIGPELASRIRAQDLRVMQSGVAESEEHEVAAGGTVRCYQVNCAPFRDEAGRLAGIVGSARDVTARKRREDELRASRQRLADAQEIAGLGNWYWEPDTGYVWWSEQTARLFGVDLSSFEPSYESYLRLVHPEDRERVVHFVDRIAESGDVGDYDVRIVRPDGQMLWLYSRSRAIRDASGRLIRLEGTDQDITERKLAEQNLRVSEQRFRDLADALPQIVWIAGKDGALEYLNRQAMEYSGLPSQQLSGWAWEDVVHPDDLDETIHGWGEAVRTGEPHDLTMRLCRADGEYRWHIARQVPIRDATGAISKWYGTCTDIHDQKLAEEMLRRSEERLAEAQRIAGIGSWYWDLTSGKVTWSDNHYRLLGRTPETFAPTWEGFLDHVHEADQGWLREFVTESVSRREHYECSFRVVRADGQVLWVQGVGRVRRDVSGEPIFVEGTLQNITERRRTEQLLQEREEFHRGVLDSVNSHIAVLNSHGDIIATNQAWRHFALENSNWRGLAARTSVGTNYLTICDESELDGCQDAAVAAAGIRQVIAGVTDRFVMDYPCHSATEPRWYVMSVTPLQHGTRGAVVVHTNVTGQKLAEHSLRDERDRFAAIVNTVPGMIFSFRLRPDGSTCLPYTSPHIASIYGLQPDDVRDNATQVLERTHPDDRKQINETIAASALSMQPWHAEFRVDHPERGLIWVEGHSLPVPEPDGSVLWHGYLAEVTERRRMNESLRESEERHRRLSEVLPSAVFINTDDRVVYCNPAMVHLFGASRAEELLGKNPLDLFHSEFHDLIRQRIEDMRSSGLPVPGIEERIVRLDGRSVPVHVVATPILDGGRPSILVAIHDLTERERSMNLLQSIMSSVMDAIVTIDGRGSIQSINRATERMFGFQENELIGQDVGLLMPESVRAEHHRSIGQYMESGVAHVIGKAREVDARRKDGTKFPIEIRVTAFLREGELNFTGVIRDLTVQRRLEQQVRESQKMEAIGRLAGGVAHDFNNLLTVINGYSDLVLTDLESDDPQKEPILAIRSAGERAARLTRQLLAFSRKAMIEPKILDLNVVVTESEKLLRRLIGEDITLVVALDRRAQPIRVDPGQVEQVIMNLIVNARDAMPTGGRLCIETQNFQLRAVDELNYPDLKPGRYVRLTVADSGSGMSEQVKARIFEPFFTTKEFGKGTGLGLAVVHGIVKQSGGHITVQSEVGVGTTFHLLFPAVEDRVQSAGGAGDRRRPTGSETVLIVEDEQPVRHIARRSLESHGYTVLEAPSGVDALRIVEQHDGPLDLLLTDVVMPGMGGREVAAAVRTLRQGIRVLYMSGYSDDAVVRHGVTEGVGAFIQKPFAPHELLRKIRSLLDNPPSS